jgi:hypothetical protein
MTPRTTPFEFSERAKQLRAWLRKVETRQSGPFSEHTSSEHTSSGQPLEQASDIAVSDAAVSNTAVSNTAVSNTAVSNTAVSNTAVSNTAVSNTAASNTAVSDFASDVTRDLGSELVHLQGVRGGRRLVSLGCMALDRLLPAGGLVPGTVVEWLEADGGGGAGSLALAAARQACHGGGLLVVLDRARRFYPPLLAAWGFSLERVVVVRPERAEDEIWAADQALRCPAVAAVWGAFDWIGAVDFRRLKLAAEEGGTLGLLRRPARLLGQPTWADAQWWVRPRIPPCRRADHAFPGVSSTTRGSHPASSSGNAQAGLGSVAIAERHLQATLVRCRGGVTGRTVTLAWNERTGQLRETNDPHGSDNGEARNGEARNGESRSKEMERIMAVRKPRAAGNAWRARETG